MNFTPVLVALIFFSAISSIATGFYLEFITLLLYIHKYKFIKLKIVAQRQHVEIMLNVKMYSIVLFVIVLM